MPLNYHHHQQHSNITLLADKGNLPESGQHAPNKKKYTKCASHTNLCGVVVTPIAPTEGPPFEDM